MANVSSLTDQEIRELLQEYGVDIGPITATTRLVYERKLTKMMGSGDAQVTSLKPKYDEAEDEDNYSDEAGLPYAFNNSSLASYTIRKSDNFSRSVEWMLGQ